MSLPSELVIEDAVSSIGDVIIYRGDHPIHGTVSVYKPDDTLPPNLARAAKERLYQSGLRMRDLSLSNLRFVTKALEVSQNPNEPYVVTEYAKHDLEELISNGVAIKPKRMFVILSQVLEAIAQSAANGWVIGHIHARQVKLPQLHAGDISLSVIESVEDDIVVDRVSVGPVSGEPTNVPTITAASRDVLGDGASIREAGGGEPADESQSPEGSDDADTADKDVDPTVTSEGNLSSKDTERQLWAVQRNIYTLGNMTYQLLFGRKYESNDKLALTNIRKLERRWRKIVEKALSEDIERRYSTYESMLQDVEKASDRNRRLAIHSAPFLLILALIAGYFAYERYREYRIMTSGAGQTIKSFLDIVNKTQDEFPELEKPEREPPQPDEQTILGPFSEIKDVNES